MYSDTSLYFAHLFTYSLFLWGKFVFVNIVKWVRFVRVIKHPFVKMVGKVKSSVIVAAILIIDDHQFGIHIVIWKNLEYFVNFIISQKKILHSKEITNHKQSSKNAWSIRQRYVHTYNIFTFFLNAINFLWKQRTFILHANFTNFSWKAWTLFSHLFYNFTIFFRENKGLFLQQWQASSRIFRENN